MGVDLDQPGPDLTAFQIDEGQTASAVSCRLDGGAAAVLDEEIDQGAALRVEGTGLPGEEAAGHPRPPQGVAPGLRDDDVAVIRHRLYMPTFLLTKLRSKACFQ